MFSPTIATSSSYNFRPTTSELIASAFMRIGVRRSEITPSHLQDGVAELNFFLAAFNDVGPNLAQVDRQSIALTAATATYAIAAETVMITDVIINYGNPSIDRYMYPLSRTEYAAIPIKTTQGVPSQYYFDRLTSPTITLYLVPDTGGPYVLYYYRWRQVQDAIAQNDLQPEVPNRAIDCIVAGLAHRLARIYAPQLEMQRKQDAMEAWQIYARQDTENAPLYITPGLAGYFRI